MSKRIVIAFFLEMDVANESVDSANESLKKFNEEDEDYVARCINVQDDEDHHGILNIEVLNEYDELDPDDIEDLSNRIKNYLEENEEIFVDDFALAER